MSEITQETAIEAMLENMRTLERERASISRRMATEAIMQDMVVTRELFMAIMLGRTETNITRAETDTEVFFEKLKTIEAAEGEDILVINGLGLQVLGTIGSFDQEEFAPVWYDISQNDCQNKGIVTLALSDGAINKPFERGRGMRDSSVLYCFSALTSTSQGYISLSGSSGTPNIYIGKDDIFSHLKRGELDELTVHTIAQYYAGVYRPERPRY